MNSEETAERIVGFLKETFARERFTTAVVGVSGGVDSAVSLSLVVRALGESNVYPVLLPYGILSTQGVLDAMELISGLRIPLTHVTRIDIRSAVDAIVTSDAAGITQIRKGNIMARVRMVYLFDQARKRNALVVGTENKSEHLLGYFTRFGDEASDIEPIMHLYKTEVYALAEYLGIPKSILTKAPSAGLWPEQTDEKEFGFTYQEADAIIKLLVDAGATVENVALEFDRGLVDRVARRIAANRFKNVTPHHLG